MSLESYKPRKITIPLDAEQSFQVRAISLNDVSLLMEVHQETIEGIYEKAKALAGKTFTEQMVTDLMFGVVQECPYLVASIIAQAADEPFQVETILKLPMPLQVDALTVIAGLTFTDMASVKKFYASVTNLIRGILPPEAKKRLAA